MNKRRMGLAIMALGLLAVVAGISLGAYNLWDNRRAGEEADSVVKAIALHRESLALTARPSPPSDVFPDLPSGDDPAASDQDPDREMPVLEVENKGYIGTLSIPAIAIELPVQENWSLALLKTAPCRYLGSVYQGDMIICAHNYVTHFGRLGNLLPGDRVIFTDIEGNEFRYTVAQMDTLADTAVEEMESGDWDLTLFTCTLGSQARVTVRCERVEGGDTPVG